jgi:hypothetical protein
MPHLNDEIGIRSLIGARPGPPWRKAGFREKVGEYNFFPHPPGSGARSSGEIITVRPAMIVVGLKFWEMGYDRSDVSRGSEYVSNLSSLVCMSNAWCMTSQEWVHMQ